MDTVDCPKACVLSILPADCAGQIAETLVELIRGLGSSVGLSGPPGVRELMFREHPWLCPFGGSGRMRGIVVRP